MRRLGYALALLFPPAAPVAAGGFSLQWPVDCTLGETCHIQQYVDHDPGPGVRDFTCGGLSYDGHKGTDIALPYLSDIQAGIRVLAAADGVVSGTRDGMADRSADDETAEAVKGRECGNGVVIRHDDGWETQYCHLRQGSIRVQTGDMVKSGATLGEIGLSGQTQFPHLHLSLRRDGAVVDPFQNGPLGTCAADTAGLWGQMDIPYQPGGLIGGGFNSAVPDYISVESGTADLSPLASDAAAIVFWTLAYGGQAGDSIVLSVQGPQGEVFRQQALLEKDQAQLFRAAGKRLKAETWPAGAYTGTAVMLRDGQEIGRYSQQMELR